MISHHHTQTTLMLWTIFSDWQNFALDYWLHNPHFLFTCTFLSARPCRLNYNFQSISAHQLFFTRYKLCISTITEILMHFEKTLHSLGQGFASLHFLFFFSQLPHAPTGNLTLQIPEKCNEKTAIKKEYSQVLSILLMRFLYFNNAGVFCH